MVESSSSAKERIVVGPVNPHVARDAILEARLGQVVQRPIGIRNAGLRRPETHHVVMAFQTQCENSRTVEQARIRAAMRVVARRAAFHAHRRVFVNEGAALVGMALDARDVVSESVAYHARRLRRGPCGRRRAVRIMTIGAVDGALIHAVLERQLKARLDAAMAVVANLALLVRQQALHAFRMMDRVATRATHFGRRMRRAPDVHLAEVLGVAGETLVNHLIRPESGKNGDLRFIAEAFDVRLARTMAAFAACFLRRLFAQSDGLKVRIPIETVPEIGMAGLARLAAHEGIRLRRSLRDCQPGQ